MNKISNRLRYVTRAATLALVVAISSSLGGCAEFAYGSLHDDAQNQCKKLVNQDERIACNKRYQQSYDSYQKDRDKLMKFK